MSKIPENIKSIQEELENKKVRIIAVTKYVGIEEILDVYKSGIRDFAENKVQDAEYKRSKLPDDIEKEITWHFVGHLQTNKVKKVVGNFEYIHSVDSVKLAKYISEEAKKREIVQKILIQVNSAEEETKFGFDVKEVKEVFQEIIKLDSIKVVGLMSIGANIRDEELIRASFRKSRELRNDLQAKYNYNLPELSMGMSGDYKIAVEEGATMIRLGQALFK